VQFRCFILFAGNGSGAKFLSRPLGASAGFTTNRPTVGSKNNLLSFEEKIERVVVRIAVGLEFRKYGLTGGEPLLRRGV